MTATIDLEARMKGRELNTLRALKDVWQANAAANAARVRHGRQVGSLWMDVNTKTGVLIAAGPSLEASLDEIKALDRETHEIVAVDMALEFLLRHGIRPDAVICADASPKIAKTLEVAGTEGISLLLNVAVHPDTAKAWQGPIFWYVVMSNVYDKDRGLFLQDAQAEASGADTLLVPGGNVSSLGLSYLLNVRAVPKVLLYGHDFCWTDEARFYCGGVASDLAAERLREEKAADAVVAMTSNDGRPVCSNASMLYFAKWFEDQMRKFPSIENRTPTSILPRGGTIC